MLNIDKRNRPYEIHAPGISFLRLPQVRERTGLSTSEIYRRVAAGTFPRQVALGGPRCVGWVDAEIAHWCAARIAERDAAGASVSGAHLR